MRVLNVIASLDPAHGGPTSTILTLGQIWRAQGHAFESATLDSPQASYLGLYDGAVIPLGDRGNPAFDGVKESRWRRYAYSPRYLPWLRRHARNYDVVLVDGLWNYTARAARRALAGGDVPYFVFTHGMLDPWFKRAYPIKHLAKALSWRINEGPLLNHATQVLFTTQDEKDLAERAFKPYRARGSVIGYGCLDVQGDAAQTERAFRASVPALGARRYLLYLSRIHPKKGCDLLIDAFAKIAAEAPDLDLVFAGPDPTGIRGVLSAQAATLGVADRLHWTGMITGDLKWGAYRGCEAFVLCSHSENFGVVVAEALAASKPVLISDKVNLWHEVAADEAGLIANDDASGAETLLRGFLALTDDERATMSANARRCYDRNYRFETLADRLIAHFRSAGVGVGS